MRVSVIGGSSVGDRTYERARELGRRLAARDHTVVCGGRGGVMEAVCRGASERNGQTIGILPGPDRSEANEYVETAIATGLGEARNAVVVRNGAAAIAVDGGPGTLSELGFALKLGRPVAGLDTLRVETLDGIEHVVDPNRAVAYVEREVGSS